MLIRALEDRRVLSVPMYLDDPRQVTTSVLEIRGLLTSALQDIPDDSAAAAPLRAMRAACRRFLEEPRPAFPHLSHRHWRSDYGRDDERPAFFVSLGDASKLAATVDLVKELGFSELVSFAVAQEHAFRIRPTDWQNLLFNHYVVSPVSRWDPFFEFEAVGYLRRYGIVDEMFEKSPRWELAERIRKICPDITTPFEAVRAYFDFLAAKEMLERDGSGWSVSLPTLD